LINISSADYNLLSYDGHMLRHAETRHRGFNWVYCCRYSSVTSIIIKNL